MEGCLGNAMNTGTKQGAAFFSIPRAKDPARPFEQRTQVVSVALKRGGSSSQNANYRMKNLCERWEKFKPTVLRFMKFMRRQERFFCRKGRMPQRRGALRPVPGSEARSTFPWEGSENKAPGAAGGFSFCVRGQASP